MDETGSARAWLNEADGTDRTLATNNNNNETKGKQMQNQLTQRIYREAFSPPKPQLANSLTEIAGNNGNSRSIARGQAWGEHVANVILAWRALDGFSTPPPSYFGSTTIPGVWRSIPTSANADGTLPAFFPQMAVLV